MFIACVHIQHVYLKLYLILYEECVPGQIFISSYTLHTLFIQTLTDMNTPSQISVDIAS